MSRRTALIIAALVVVGIVSAGIAIIDPFGWRTSATRAVNATPTQSPSPPPADAIEAAQALNKLAEDPASLASKTIKQRVSSNAAAAVQPGSTIEPDTSTWGPNPLGGGTMEVAITPPGQPKRQFIALMGKEGGAWKVKMTWPVTPATKTPAVNQ